MVRGQGVTRARALTQGPGVYILIASMWYSTAEVYVVDVACVIEYDMAEFFQSRVDLYAELTDTDPANYPAVGTPFGIEHTDLEDGQGGPRGEISSPSMETLANLLGIDAPMGQPA